MDSFIFWFFQVINTLTAIGMFFSPKKFHESMMREPEKVYSLIGFSPTAVKMVHQVIRGQGAALLAISMTLFFQGPSQSSSYLLIALTCGLTLIAHVGTTMHHSRNHVVMSALGSIRPMYFILAVNFIAFIAAGWIFLKFL